MKQINHMLVKCSKSILDGIGKCLLRMTGGRAKRAAMLPA